MHRSWRFCGFCSPPPLTGEWETAGALERCALCSLLPRVRAPPPAVLVEVACPPHARGHSAVRLASKWRSRLCKVCLCRFCE